MKLIIDISEEEWLFIKAKIATEDDSYIDRAVANSTPIPDNATNGDMIKAIFNCKTRNEDSNYLVKYSLDGIYEEVSSDWWNAPYQKDSRVE